MPMHAFQYSKAKLKKNVCLALPTQGFTWLVGRSAFFLKIFTICTWTEMVKKKNLRIGKKIILSSSKTDE